MSDILVSLKLTSKSKQLIHRRDILVYPKPDTDKEQLNAVIQIVNEKAAKYLSMDTESPENPGNPVTAVLQTSMQLVLPLLDTISRIDASKADFVVVKSIKEEALSNFEEYFKQQKFYVLSVYEPEFSYNLSEMTNKFAEKSRMHLTKRREIIKKNQTKAIEKADLFNKQLQENIEEIKIEGFTKARDIVCQLNARGLKTRQGEEWEIHNFYRAQNQIEKIQSGKPKI